MGYFGCFFFPHLFLTQMAPTRHLFQTVALVHPQCARGVSRTNAASGDQRAGQHRGVVRRQAPKKYDKWGGAIVFLHIMDLLVWRFFLLLLLMCFVFFLYFFGGWEAVRDGARQTEETEIKEGGDGERDKLPINSFHYPVAAAEYSSLIDSLSINPPPPSPFPQTPAPTFSFLSILHLNVSILPHLSSLHFHHQCVSS